MVPTLGHIGPVPVGTHDVFVGLGVLAAALVFLAEVRRRRDRRRPDLGRGGRRAGRRRAAQPARHLGATRRPAPERLAGGAVGLRQPQHPVRPASARTSAPCVAKRLVGYRDETGDLFAPAVALGMAVGRVGCLLTELPGTPTGLPWGDHADARRGRGHPGRGARRAAAPVVRVRDRLSPRRVRRAVVAARPADRAGRAVQALPRRRTRLPFRGRVRARQRGGVRRPDPAAAVPARLPAAARLARRPAGAAAASTDCPTPADARRPV